MKKIFITFAAILGSIQLLNAQWTTVGDMASQYIYYNSGKVGIGTTVPSTALDVNGTIKTSSLEVVGRGASDAGIQLHMIPGQYNVIRGTVNNVSKYAIHFFEEGWQGGGANKSAGMINFGTPKGVSFGGWDQAYVVFRSDNERVGIGTTNPDEKLTVNGNIHAKEVRVDLAIPADYVFQKYYTGISALKSDYQMLTLTEIEQFTKKNYHLPNIPSAKDIQENGLKLGEMNNLLLQKIEELTIYTIEQEKKITDQKLKNSELEKRIVLLEDKLNEIIK